MGITFTLNNTAVTAADGETILQAAERHGVDIPRLCYQDGMRPDGNCRACVVEVDGERALAPACCRRPAADMKVTSDSGRALAAQKMVLELLLSDMGATERALNSELSRWRDALGVGAPRFPSRTQPPADLSHPAIAVNLDSCIQCTRCVRACREEQVNDVIGYAGRGAEAAIVFDFGDAMGASSCVGCGECVQACPTGALMPAGDVGLQKADRTVDSVCPYCGVGCLLRYHVKDNRILHVQGRDGPSNHSRLCVKGRYGFDYVTHPHRLMRPLMRRADAPPKSADFTLDPGDAEAVAKVFREVDWDEALDFAADGLGRIRDRHGGEALAGFGSAKGSNEEAYLFQKLVRTGFGSNNVDHCTRLCHASSVAALLEGIGSGAVSNQVADCAEAEVIVVIGANPTENHPVAATFMKNAARAGRTLIVMDPRRTELARHADHFLQFNPDTDVALLNAMMHTIVSEGLCDDNFIRERTADFERMRDNVAAFSPESMAPVCGIDAATIRTVARRYATAAGSIIFWGMGISQHVHGTDNARCLIALALMTGQIGRPGTGLHPLRGQNNVQGASDAGLIPMMFPDYHRVDGDARVNFESAWNTSLSDKPGLTVVEIMHAISAGKIRGMYVMGENPAMSDPNLHHARAALAALEHLVVQDLFLTETAFLADVVLPASAFPEKTGTFTNTDRRVQLGRAALPLPGDTRQDLDIIGHIARRLGLDWNYADSKQVFAEMRGVMPSIAGLSWERLEREHSVTYPCVGDDDPGQGVVFRDNFPTADGRGRFVPAQLLSADELPDDDYPCVLITGRQLEHWHTGAMTRRASVLDAIQPSPVVSLHPDLLQKLGATDGAPITVQSRRGQLTATARADNGLRPGDVFIPFCYHEAAANLLTNEAIDPVGKIPEFKYCAVRVVRQNQFDTVAMVDWSGGNDTGRQPRKDAVWLAVARQGVIKETVYLRNRQCAEAKLVELIEQEKSARRRLLIGLDFPFAYPAGFSQALTGKKNPLAVWDWLEKRICDTPESNNRFDLAGEINQKLRGEGPFWGNLLERNIPGLGRKKCSPAPFAERRKVEQLATGSFTCWQLMGAGAVGSQVLMGLPVLSRLRRRFADDLAVWPFGATDKSIVLAEIWPSLIAEAVRQAQGEEDFRDEVQVRLLAKALSSLPEDVMQRMLTVDSDEAQQEGWILGLGFEKELEKFATRK